VPGINKNNTQFFSSLLPQELLGEIAGYLEDKKTKVTVDAKKYKFKATIAQSQFDDDEDGEDEEMAEVNEDEQ